MSMRLRRRSRKRNYAESLQDDDDEEDDAGHKIAIEEDAEPYSVEDDKQNKRVKRNSPKKRPKKATKASKNKKPKADDPDVTLAIIPPECMYMIMEYSDSRICHVLANSSKSIRNMLTYDLVIKTALLALPITFPDVKLDRRLQESKYPTNKPLQRIDAVVHDGIREHSLVIPSPQRLLSLLNGRKCEMGFCTNTVGDENSPDLINPASLECGIFACPSCIECWSSPARWVRCEKYVEVLGNPFNDNDPMYWRAPYYSPTGERIGPALTMADADDIVQSETTTENEVSKIIDVRKEQELLAAFEAACSRRVRYTQDRQQLEQEKINTRLNIKRDQIVNLLRETHGKVDWFDIVMKRKENGTFEMVYMQHCIDYQVQKTLDKSVKFAKKTAQLYVDQIVKHYEDIRKVDFLGMSFLKDKSTPVEQYWYKKWKAEAEEDKAWLWKKVCAYFNPSLLCRGPFHGLATMKLGENCGPILILGALPRDCVAIDDEAAVLEEIELAWDSDPVRLPSIDDEHPAIDFAKTCDRIYNALLVEYAK